MRARIKAWPYCDLSLIAFLLPLLAAQTITAHGSLLFYSYLLPPALAIPATIVLAVGVPLLEAAGVLDREHRWQYLSGMGFLVLLEGVAQYFQGQSWFVTRIHASFADARDVDLVTLAEQPGGRALVVFYLAALSLVVVGFGWAAAHRVQQIRARLLLEAAEANELAKLGAELANVSREKAEALAQLASGDEERATLRETLATTERELAQLRDEAFRPRVTPVALPPTRARILGYVRAQLAGERSLSEIARELDFSESTVRGWLDKVSQNGHSVEVSNEGRD